VIAVVLSCRHGATAQQAPSRYPEFSWDKVPVAFHFGNTEAMLPKEQAEFVALHSNFICLEKGHAIGQFRDTETGIESEAQQLKKINSKLKVIFYWNTFLDYSIYKAHAEYQRHPEWWLKNLDGTLDLKQGGLKRYGLSNPAVRHWWTSVAREAVVNGSADGVFMDAFPQVTNSANLSLWGDEKYNAIQQGLKDTIKETRSEIGDDKLIVYHGIRSTDSWNAGFDFPEHTDAAPIERCRHFHSSSKECMLRDIQMMKAVGKRGKMVVLKGWPGFTFIDRVATLRLCCRARHTWTNHHSRAA
jgi:hypothetical protein